MTEPTFVLCYTSARAREILPVVGKWQTRAAFPDRIRWAVTVDTDKHDCVAVINQLKDVPQLRIVTGSVTDLPGTCVKGWNLAAELAAPRPGEVIIAVADDFEPPAHWDAILTACAPAGWWYEPRVVHVADGYNHDIFTLSIETQAWYEKFGYLFYPKYLSIYADTEHTAVSTAAGVVINATNIVFEHRHPDCGKRTRDSVDLNHSNNSRYEMGRLLFEYRRANGFPVDLGPRAKAHKEVTVNQLMVYFQVIKDDVGLYAVAQRLYDEGLRNFLFWVPDEYWSGKVVSPEEIHEVQVVADRLRELPETQVVLNKIICAPHRVSGEPRIVFETRIRNLALDYVESQGYYPIIVDGDEIWKIGLLGRLLDLVNSSAPRSVHAGLIPVVGVPGYPVEGALDKATIYLDHGVRFKDCRGPDCPSTELPGYDIYHFTATRTSLDEVISKHRESGHYSDPSYDFEGWIANVLPTIRAGDANVHMYDMKGRTGANPWKRVRNWRPAEWREIPTDFHKYMAK